ncbi:MAG: gliding motility protein GldM [Bacteroidales bacterium]|nr:gliding motility protein GldM [Bacteroidales bacterium]
MSGGNCPETPRQKMIGMMYLMLTAMLALNVSGDLLNAFTLVDKSIREQKASTEEKLYGTYYNFEAKVAENKARFGSKYEDACKVRAMSDSLVNYIQSIKQEMVNVADGYGSGATPDSFTNISNQDIAMQVMDVELPRVYTKCPPANAGYPGLLKQIADYREALISFIKNDSVLSIDTVAMNRRISNVEHMLKTCDMSDTPGGRQARRDWASQQFEHLPLAASFGLLSSIQASTRLVENDIVNGIYGSIDAASFKFNKLEALVIPEAQYVIQGGTYKADIMLAAYDETLIPEVVVEGRQLEVKDGRGKYQVPASSVGKRSFTATLTVPDPLTGQPKSYPAKAEYEVGAPSLVVSATKMNAMYRGLANPIEVSVAGVSASDLNVACSGGTLSKGAEGYVVKPSSANEINISVTSNAGGKSQNFGSKKFRVYDVPNPEVRFVINGTPVAAGKSIQKSSLNNAKVAAVLENFVFDVKFDVTEFVVSTTKGGFLVDQKNVGSSLQKPTQDLIKGVPRKGKIFVESVKAKGPDGRERRLNGVSLTVE